MPFVSIQYNGTLCIYVYVFYEGGSSYLGVIFGYSWYCEKTIKMIQTSISSVTLLKDVVFTSPGREILQSRSPLGLSFMTQSLAPSQTTSNWIKLNNVYILINLNNVNLSIAKKEKNPLKKWPSEHFCKMYVKILYYELELLVNNSFGQFYQADDKLTTP